VELTPGPGTLAAALLQLADQARQVADLDAREQAHAADAAGRIAALTTLAETTRDWLDGPDGMLAHLDQRISDLAARLDHTLPVPAGEAGGAGYLPEPQRRFWQLHGEAREQAVARLRAWVDEVYRPGYGHLAATLGDCWEQHPLCLYMLDWLSELWAVLYLDPARTPDTLAGQAEWQARLLDAAAAQMARETARCPHARPAPAARTLRPPR
jgi:hypothetical protein